MRKISETAYTSPEGHELRDHHLENLRLRAQGMRSPEIALARRINTNTLKNQSWEARRALGVGSNIEAIQKAIALGLISLPAPIPHSLDSSD